MKISFKVDKKILNPFIVIHADKETDSLLELAASIEHLCENQIITGYSDRKSFAIPVSQIIRFYTESNNVFCQTDSGRFKVKERISFLENKLPPKIFLRISSSEIISVHEIRYFSLSKAGMFQISLTNGEITYASRRYVQKIKKELIK